jgi:outer membrane usher protein
MDPRDGSAQGRHLWRSACSGLMVVALFLLAVSTVRAEQQRAILALVVNDLDKGQALVLLEDKDIWIEVHALEEAGLQGFKGQRQLYAQRTFVSLASLAPSVTFEFDEPGLIVRLKVKPELFGTFNLALQGNRPDDVIYRRNNSAFVNYGLNYRSKTGFDASAETGVSIGGALFSTVVTRTVDGQIVRGYTHATIDDRTHLRRWTIGDSLVTTGVLGGGAVMGGLTVAREYGLDPYFVRFPTLGFAGALETPATVEMYVNDQLVTRQELPPGQFTLSNLVAPNGSGQTRFVIRDAFGRQQDYSSSYYLTNSLLAKGLQEYRYTVGWPRLNSGTQNFDYGRPAFLAYHRVGLSDAITLGGRMEAGAAMMSGGPVLNARLWKAGEIELAAGVSREHGASGTAFSAGYSYAGHPFSFSASVRSYSRSYATLSLDQLTSRPRLEADLAAGFHVGRAVSVTIQQTLSATQAATENRRWNPRTTLYVQSQLSRRLSLFVSASSGRVDGAAGSELLAGASLSLGQQTSGTLALSAANGRSVAPQLELQRSLPTGEGYGYRVRLSDQAGGQSGGLVQYQGRFGRYEIEQSTEGLVQRTSLSVSGAIVTIGGNLFASRPVQDSFALIRVPGVAGVSGYADNHKIGKTDGDGNLLVPSLLPYYGNVLSVADQDIPFNFGLTATRQRVAPPYRGGAVVTFTATKLQFVTGTALLEIEGETVVPSYGQMTITAGGRTYESPIGLGGEFYFENLPVGRHVAVIEYNGTTCEVTLAVPESKEPAIGLGAVRCAVPRTGTGRADVSGPSPLRAAGLFAASPRDMYEGGLATDPVRASTNRAMKLGSSRSFERLFMDATRPTIAPLSLRGLE